MVAELNIKKIKSKIEGIFMKNIKIYNYNKIYDKDLINIIISSLKNAGEYYISRSWENGPQVIVTLNNNISMQEINDIKNQISIKLSEIPVDKEYLIAIKQQYLRNQQIISKLEKKACEENTLKPHNTIEIIENEFKYFNEGFTNIIHSCRYTLQPLLNELYFILENETQLRFNLKNKEMNLSKILPVLCHVISECYKYDDKNKGFFSYISHVQGFFELSKKQGVPYSEELFESIFKQNFEHMKSYCSSNDAFLEKWYIAWADIMNKLKIEIPKYMNDSYIKNLFETFNALEQDYDNDFHKNFVRYAKNKDFVNDIEATAYRFLINIFYLSLPFIKVSALKKQIYIYMAYRYAEYVYDIDWREVASGEL